MLSAPTPLQAGGIAIAAFLASMVAFFLELSAFCGWFVLVHVDMTGNHIFGIAGLGLLGLSALAGLVAIVSGAFALGRRVVARGRAPWEHRGACRPSPRVRVGPPRFKF